MLFKHAQDARCAVARMKVHVQWFALQVCCVSGNVDNAGICDGTGNTIPKNVGLSDVVPPVSYGSFGSISLSRRRLLLEQPWLDMQNAFITLAKDVLKYPPDLFKVLVVPNADGTDATVRFLSLPPLTLGKATHCIGLASTAMR